MATWRREPQPHPCWCGSFKTSSADLNGRGSDINSITSTTSGRNDDGASAVTPNPVGIVGPFIDLVLLLSEGLKGMHNELAPQDAAPLMYNTSKRLDSSTLVTCFAIQRAR